MSTGTRRNFVGKITAMTALVTGASKLFAEQASATGASASGNAPASAPGKDLPIAPAPRATHTTGSTTFLGRVPMTAIPRTITFS